MGKNEISKRKIISNFIWRFAERSGAQLVAFVVSIVLARILEPQIYGTIALVMVFITILNVFVDSGLGNALIQKKDADDIDFSTVFFANLVFCALLYLGMFFFAPLIAKIYDNISLVPIIRVLSLTLIISGVKNVQQAYVSRHLLFRKFFFSTLGGTIAAAIVGIIMAMKGFGVWALVAQQLVNATIDTIILWFTVRWRPHKCFSFKRLKVLYSYGWKLLASSLIYTIYCDLSQLIIGKFYTSAELAFYNKGNQFPRTIVNNINNAIDSVLLPTMSLHQDDTVRVKNMTRRAIMVSTYVMAPLMMGLAFTSKNVVVLLLTDKWIECVPFMVLFSITHMFWPIHTANLNAIKAIGRSDIFFKLEIIKEICGLIVLVSFMWFGVKAIAYSSIITSIMSQVINSWPNKKLLNYSLFEQLKDIIPNILMALIMGGIVMCIPVLFNSLLLTLVVQIIIGAVIYIGESFIFKNQSFLYIMDMIRKGI